jgi:two-component system, NtrC family, response regulator AtoC
VALDVRILASSSANIERALAEGKLREDLYYRLSAFTVQVPPLRQRRGEISILLSHLMHKLARHYGLPAREFSSVVLDACQRHSWPGNLTELEAFVKRYLVAGQDDLSFDELNAPAADNGRAGRASMAQATMQSTARASAGNPADTPAHFGGGNGQEAALPKSLKSLIQSVKSEAERNAIANALHKTGWNRKAAARLLQVSYRTLLYKIDQYQMHMSDPLLPPPAGERYLFEQSTVKGNGNGNGKAS